ncbi:MAG: pyridoxamine kinase [Eubacteriales bacterium]|nr:pyridoxamine kinase [Eubacteriales bacterium]
MQKRALAIHDISCVGRCSLTVALPILSAAGVNTAVVPTALLSTHTGEFTGYTHLDLSDQLLPIANHLATLGLHFDAFYTGYLAGTGQIDRVLAMIDLLCDAGTHIFVDPAFADHGKLYSLLESNMPVKMRALCARARTIVPNLTEAALLLGVPYRAAGYDESYVLKLARGLAELGPESVVITDVSLNEAQSGIAVYSRAEDAMQLMFRPKLPGVFHGTGDVFASFLLSALLGGLSLTEAADLALSCTHESIRLTLEGGEALRYGVQFERVLPRLIDALQNKPQDE